MQWYYDIFNTASNSSKCTAEGSNNQTRVSISVSLRGKVLNYSCAQSCVDSWKLSNTSMIEHVSQGFHTTLMGPHEVEVVSDIYNQMLLKKFGTEISIPSKL